MLQVLRRRFVLVLRLRGRASPSTNVWASPVAGTLPATNLCALSVAGSVPASRTFVAGNHSGMIPTRLMTDENATQSGANPGAVMNEVAAIR
jgi:hypothetical protein